MWPCGLMIGSARVPSYSPRDATDAGVDREEAIGIEHAVQTFAQSQPWCNHDGHERRVVCVPVPRRLPLGAATAGHQVEGGNVNADLLAARVGRAVAVRRAVG